MKVLNGIDIVEIKRFERVLNRWSTRFLNRVFTTREQNECKGVTKSLAARFAAKEAVAKTLETGFIGFEWKDVEIVKALAGFPEVVLHNGAKTRALNQKWTSISLSLSHDAGLALAMVTVLRDTDN